MEPNELDDLFKKILTDKTAAQKTSGQTSKEAIWNQLDINKDQPARVFPIWKIAAAILFLMLGGAFLINQQQQQAHIQEMAKLEKKFIDLQTALDQSQNELANLQSSTKTPTPSNQPPTTVIKKEIETLVKNKIIHQYDTVWLEKNSPAKEVIVYQKDTVYIEKTLLIQEDSGALVSTPVPDKKSTKKENKKLPSSVEFIFDTKVELNADHPADGLRILGGKSMIPEKKLKETPTVLRKQ